MHVFAVVGVQRTDVCVPKVKGFLPGEHLLGYGGETSQACVHGEHIEQHVCTDIFYTSLPSFINQKRERFGGGEFSSPTIPLLLTTNV